MRANFAGFSLKMAVLAFAMLSATVACVSIQPAPQNAPTDEPVATNPGTAPAASSVEVSPPTAVDAAEGLPQEPPAPAIQTVAAPSVVPFGRGWIASLSVRDCRGIATKDRSWCVSADCRALASGDRAWCQSIDCKGVASGDRSWCTTALCKAWASRDRSWCESGDGDCKGVASRDRSWCESPACKAIATGDASWCR